jgi:endonuclease/exonuclease/phosphatase family metal-dependent hydrolase
MLRPTSLLSVPLSLSLSLLLPSCLVEEHALDEDLDADLYEVTVPAKGAANTLDIASWNIEWFGSTANGPTNENLQLSNATDVIAGTDFDIWGVAEIVSTSQFNSLKSKLSGYAGFLANDPLVTSGSSFYTTSEQKVGILYKSSVATLQSARIILTQNDYEFAGRPPLEVKLRVSVNGVTDDIVVIVLHAKAFDDTASWQRRRDASIALKSYLDSTYPTQKVMVVGDFNDDVDTSITAGQQSPYQNFVNDSADYEFLTEPLSLSGQSSTVSYPDVIDHHLASDDMAGAYIANTVQIYRVDQYIASYGTSTSDHYPVLTRYDLTGSLPPPPPPPPPPSTGVFLNEILANEPGSSTSGELIELVNGTSGDIDLSGCTLSDSTSVRHTFAAGTTLAAGKAIVVFASASAIPGGLSNAVASSTGTLSLNNTGETVSLKNGAGTVMDSFTYSSSLAGTDGVSMNRNPDGSASGSFVLHTALVSASSSPGKRVNNTSF